jgi:hypothetical protein
MIRNDAILTPERLEKIRAAWTRGKVLEELAASHGVKLDVLRRYMRKYFPDLRYYGTPNVHPDAYWARQEALWARKLEEFDRGLAALPLPRVKGKDVPKPSYRNWPR